VLGAVLRCGGLHAAVVDAGQIKAGKPGVSSSAAAVRIDWTEYWNDPSPMIAIAGRLRPVSRSPSAAPLPRR
jgi:hypothetical protein